MVQFTYEDNHVLQAIEEGCKGVMTGHGGPFGAVIVEANTGNIIARGCNKVLLTKDPTAHAEVVAIREACAKLNRFSLHDCVIYASCQPCPMCLSAIVWAKLPHCIYSALPDDAAQAGFDDRFLYDYIQGKTVTQKLILTHAPHPQSGKPFAAYSDALRQNRKIHWNMGYVPMDILMPCFGPSHSTFNIYHLEISAQSRLVHIGPLLAYDIRIHKYVAAVCHKILKPKKTGNGTSTLATSGDSSSTPGRRLRR